MKQQINRFQRKMLSPAKRGASFTLIEMLTVIAIIIILAGIIFTGMKGALWQTKKTKAGSDAKTIYTLISAYYTEYGKWPSCSDGTQLATQGEIMAVLAGNELTNPAGGGLPAQRCFGIGSANPKQMPFFTIPQRDSCTDSTNLDPVTNHYFIDPWSVPYNIALDTNYDNRITHGIEVPYLAPIAAPYCGTISLATAPTWNNNDSLPALSNNDVVAGVIVWSNGLDRINGWGDTRTSVGKDDITTWAK